MFKLQNPKTIINENIPKFKNSGTSQIGPAAVLVC